MNAKLFLRKNRIKLEIKNAQKINFVRLKNISFYMKLILLRRDQTNLKIFSCIDMFIVAENLAVSDTHD